MLQRLLGRDLGAEGLAMPTKVKDPVHDSMSFLADNVREGELELISSDAFREKPTGRMKPYKPLRTERDLDSVWTLATDSKLQSATLFANVITRRRAEASMLALCADSETAVVVVSRVGSGKTEIC